MKTVYYNGIVYKGEGEFCSAFSVEDGIFKDVGTDDELLGTMAASDEAVDLGGRFVCAGFNDSHMHLLNYGQTLSFAPLFEHTDSLASVLACLKEKLNDISGSADRWLCGRGWNQDYFCDEKRMPNRYDLDTVSKNVPIMITRACGHCCVLNSKALEIANITSQTPIPKGGAIGTLNGEPDGILFDNAMDILIDVMPKVTKDDIKSMIRSACSKLNGYGITSVQTDDYCVFRDVPPETVNAAYMELEKAGELSVRVYEQCNFTDLESLKAFIEEGNTTGTGSDMFRIGPLKLLGDGAIGSRTAHLSMPYLDDGKNRGFSLYTDEQMHELVSCANEHGMQVAIHAIGDACLDSVLDSIESALIEHPQLDHRHGIVHCQISRADQLERIAKLGLHVYAQSIFLDYDNHVVEKLVPKELTKTSYSWKTLIKKGVSVSNGSDCPVELPDVMKGIQCAVTRRSIDGTGPFIEDEAFTVAEALDSFTIKGAEASFEEARKGLILEGYLADFVILGADPFAAEPDELHKIPILKTFLSGRAV